MRCPKCGNESNLHHAGALGIGVNYCSECRSHWTSWQAALIEEKERRIDELEKNQPLSPFCIECDESKTRQRIDGLVGALKTAMQIIQPNFSGHIQTECQCGVCEWIRLADRLLRGKEEGNE